MILNQIIQNLTDMVKLFFLHSKMKHKSEVICHSLWNLNVVYKIS